MLPNNTVPSYGTIVDESRSTIEVEQDSTTYVPALSSRYESIDYDEPENDLYLKEANVVGIHGKLFRKTVNRWTVCFLSGFGTAIAGSVINILIYYVTSWKFRILQTYIEHSYVSSWAFAQPLLIWIFFNCGFTFLSALIAALLAGPVAAGSGIPQIKSFLNGVKIPEVVSLKTLIAKMVGLICSMAGGLVIGKEGPMVHIGACIAAGISQGKTIGEKFIDCHVFDYFRTDLELRDFVSVGAATGITAAFGAPIGGVLFSLEETASYWKQSLTWRMFFATMVTMVFTNLILSSFYGYSGLISWSGLVDLSVVTIEDYYVWELFLYAFLGVIGGLSGSLYNFLQYRLTLFRMNFVSRQWHRVCEVVLIAGVTAVLGFGIIMLYADCRTLNDLSSVTAFPVKSSCISGQYSATAGVHLHTAEDSLKTLLHSPSGTFGIATLFLLLVEEFILSFWTVGTPVPSGLLIPSLLIGAIWGRIVAELVKLMFPRVTIEIGKFALAGAAAQTVGVTRLTISLTIILIEATQSTKFILPLIIVVLCAKCVADALIPDLYGLYLKLSEVPILDWEPPQLSHNIRAKSVVVINEFENVGNIYRILKTDKHQAYPVVEKIDESRPTRNRSNGKLKGLITRDQLIVLLERKAFTHNEDGVQLPPLEKPLKLSYFRRNYPTHQTRFEHLQLTEFDQSCWIDLQPIMNVAPFMITQEASLTKIFQLFRGLGLHHSVVVDSNHRVCGIVTRKDVAKYKVERTADGQYSLQQLLISDDAGLILANSTN